MGNSQMQANDTGKQVRFGFSTLKKNLPDGVYSQVCWGDGNGGVSAFGHGINEPNELLANMLYQKSLRSTYDTMRAEVNEISAWNGAALSEKINEVVQKYKGTFSRYGVEMFFCRKYRGKQGAKYWFEFIDKSIADPNYTPDQGLPAWPGCPVVGFQAS